MKRFLKKEYLLIIFIFIMVLSVIIINQVGDLDELWNYNVAKNIADGKLPYKDISTITTPLLPFINSIFLKLISNELIMMRILTAILATAILYMIFKILKTTVKETNFSLIVTISIGWLFKDVFCIDYNYMALLLCLIILYLELKNDEKPLLIGVLAGLAICTKQSIGLMIAIGTVIAPLIKITKKQDIKPTLKEIGKRIIGIAIPCIILLVYLLVTNSFQDFMSYAVYGIATFNNNVPYSSLLRTKDIVIKILSFAMPIIVVANVVASIIIKIRKKEKEEFETLQKLTLYSLPMLTVIYPISDKIHFLIGITILLIAFSYSVFLIGKQIYKKINYKHKKLHYKTITLIIWVTMCTVTAIVGITSLNNYILKLQEGKLNQEIAHYKNIEIEADLKNKIIEFDKYIKEKENEGNKVYVLDAEAAIYTIPIDNYTKDFDMLLKGNLGKDGEEGVIQKIENITDEKTIYLLKKDGEALNWQTPLKVIKYVKENFKLVGEIENYDAYMR